jgi:hypothetical protein
MKSWALRTEGSSAFCRARVPHRLHNSFTVIVSNESRTAALVRRERKNSTYAALVCALSSRIRKCVHAALFLHLEWKSIFLIIYFIRSRATGHAHSGTPCWPNRELAARHNPPFRPPTQSTRPLRARKWIELGIAKVYLFVARFFCHVANEFSLFTSALKCVFACN